MAGASGIRMGKVFVEIGADASAALAAFGKLNKRIGQIGASMSSFGTRIGAIGAAIAAPVGLAMRQFAQFDDAIRATAAVSQASGADLQKLNDKARELGATTSFTAIQVATLMGELGRAGFKPDEINAMTGAVLDLARASGTDAVRASGIMAATLRQFGLGATEATRAADVLTHTANATFNSVESLGESLKYAGPVAKSLGMSLEDTAAILGVLGNVGIQGSEAGTALRRLGVISAGAGKELKALFGVSNTDAEGNLKPLVDILDEINTVTSNMPVAERTKRMADAFGLLGITSANVLSQSAGGVRDLANELRNAQGTAARTAKEMDAGLGGAFRIAMSAVEGTALAIGDALAPSAIKLLNTIEGLATGLTKFVKENEALVVSAAKGIAVFTGVGVALVGIGMTLSLLSTSVAGFMTAFGGIAAVVGLALSPIGLLVAGVTAAVMLGPQLKGAFSGVLDGLADGAGAVGQVFSGMSADASVVFSDLASIATTTFNGIYEAIAGGDLSGAMDVLWAGLKAGWLRGIESIVIAWHRGVGEIQKAFVSLGSAWDKYVTKPASMFGIRVAEASQERNVLGAFDTTQGTIFDNESKKAARGRRQVAERLLSTGTAEEFTANRAAAEQQMAGLQQVVDRGAAAGATDADRKAAEAASKEIAAYREAIGLVKARFAQLGIKTEEQRQAAIEQAKTEIDAATERSIAATKESAVSAAADLQNMTRSQRDKRIFSSQANSVTDSLGTATTMDSVRELAQEFHLLAKTGAVTDSQMKAFADAAEAAQDRISTGVDATGSATPVDGEGLRRAAMDASAGQAEVVGTFSSNLSGMGFGSSLAQKQLDEQKKTNQILEDKLGAGAVQE